MVQEEVRLIIPLSHCMLPAVCRLSTARGVDMEAANARFKPTKAKALKVLDGKAAQNICELKFQCTCSFLLVCCWFICSLSFSLSLSLFLSLSLSPISHPPSRTLKQLSIKISRSLFLNDSNRKERHLPVSLLSVSARQFLT